MTNREFYENQKQPNNTKVAPLQNVKFLTKWSGQWCKCYVCGDVKICTPHSEFFATPEGTLYCEECFSNSIG